MILVSLFSIKVTLGEELRLDKQWGPARALQQPLSIFLADKALPREGPSQWQVRACVLLSSILSVDTGTEAPSELCICILQVCINPIWEINGSYKWHVSGTLCPCLPVLGLAVHGSLRAWQKKGEEAWGQAFPKHPGKHIPPTPPKLWAAHLGLPPRQESQNSQKHGTSPQTGDDGLFSTPLSSFWSMWSQIKTSPKNLNNGSVRCFRPWDLPLTSGLGVVSERLPEFFSSSFRGLGPHLLAGTQWLSFIDTQCEGLQQSCSIWILFVRSEN